MNKLSVFYEHICDAAKQRDMSVEEVLSAAFEMGFCGVDCDYWRLTDRESFSSLLKSSGMSVSSIYRFYDFVNKDREQSLSEIKEHLEAAAYFGADKVLAVPGFITERDNASVHLEKMCGMLSEMCAMAESYGITVMIEDFDDSASPCSTIAGLEYFLKNVPGLRFNFDTGNFAYSLESLWEAYGRLREYISYVHVKDRSRLSQNGDGKPDLSGAVMYPSETGGGYIGTDSTVRRLIADGYRGGFAAEHFGAADQLLFMKRSAENLKCLISEELQYDKYTYLE